MRIIVPPNRMKDAFVSASESLLGDALRITSLTDLFTFFLGFMASYQPFVLCVLENESLASLRPTIYNSSSCPRTYACRPR